VQPAGGTKSEGNGAVTNFRCQACRDPTGKDALVEAGTIDVGIAVRDTAAVAAVGAAIACSLNQDAKLLEGLSTTLGSPIQSITFGPCTAEVEKCVNGTPPGAVYPVHRLPNPRQPSQSSASQEASPRSNFQREPGRVRSGIQCQYRRDRSANDKRAESVPV
jgi:hypothetical protein